MPKDTTNPKLVRSFPLHLPKEMKSPLLLFHGINNQNLTKPQKPFIPETAYVLKIWKNQGEESQA